MGRSYALFRIRNIRKAAVVAAALMFSASALFAGPFGLEAGWTEDEMVNGGAVIEERMSYDPYRLGMEIMPPTLHRSFDDYYAIVDSDYGLYEIAAVKTEEALLAEDLDLITEYELVKNQLTEVYGEPLSFEFLDEKTDEPDMDEFPADLWRLERTVESYWFLPMSEPFALVILRADMDPRTEEGLELIYWAKVAETVAERNERSDVQSL